MVQIKVENGKSLYKQTSLLVIGIFENEKENLELNQLDPEILSVIKENSEKEFEGTEGSNFVLHTMGKGPMKRIMLIGLGIKEGFTNEKARIIAGKAALHAKNLGLTEFCIIPFSKTDVDLIEAMSEGIYLSLYSFNRYKTIKKVDSDFSSVTILVNSDESKFQSVVDKSKIISESVNFGRDLSNLPPNDCSPAQLTSFALSLTNEDLIKSRILERYEMESIGLSAIISVGKGSNNPPKLIILEYNGTTDNEKPYLLVGKAVTFDTGGISLKPGDKMEEMKFDKCGGCNVLAIVRAIALLNLPVNVVGIVPSVENMPSGTSYRPGDVIKMYNGKTVEVVNTDAEGRLILADAMAYGIDTYKPKAVIDMATLTGACIIALGANVAAMMGTNSELINKLRKYGESTGEKMWELPLFDEFHEQIKSVVADIKNIGGRAGGAITAAAFLSNFIKDVPWVHLDIAGTAWTQDGTYDRSYNPKGATGFGIRTLIKFLENSNNEL